MYGAWHNKPFFIRLDFEGFYFRRCCCGPFYPALSRRRVPSRGRLQRAGCGRPAAQDPFSVEHDIGCGHCGSLLSAIEKGTGGCLSLMACGRVGAFWRLGRCSPAPPPVGGSVAPCATGFGLGGMSLNGGGLHFFVV